MNREQFLELLSRYIGGKASKEEILLFDAFYESFQKSGKTWQELGLSDKDQLLLEVYLNINRKTFEQPNIIRRLPSVVRVASIALIVLISAFVLYKFYSTDSRLRETTYITESTQPGQKKEIILNDSSHVYLNASSQITYPINF